MNNISYADDTNISIHTGIYLKHTITSRDNLVEEFNNNFFDIEIRVNDDDKAFQKVLFGVFTNSEGDRCILLGAQKKWQQITDRLVIEGVYAYAGEFFFDEFSHCGDASIYKKIKDKTGLGFAPYIYHGLEYRLTENIGIQTGFIIPLILVATIQFYF